MNRKDFFRGLVGTAVMASLPAVLKPEKKLVFQGPKKKISEIYKDSIYACHDDRTRCIRIYPLTPDQCYDSAKSINLNDEFIP